MKKKNSAALMKRLIDNQITREELEKLLEGMDDKETTEKYETCLREHFDKIMSDYAINEGRKKNL